MALLDILEQPFEQKLILGSNRIVSFGDNPHDNPSNFDQWFEPLAVTPQPWTFSTTDNKWYSTPVQVHTGTIPAVIQSALGNTALRDVYPIPHEYENFDIFLRRVTFDTNIQNGAHSATNFYSFSVRWYGASTTGAWSNPAFANIATFSTATYTTNARLYRSTITPSSALLSNGKGFSIDGTKTGTPAGFNCAFTFSFRLIRK